MILEISTWFLIHLNTQTGYNFTISFNKFFMKMTPFWTILKILTIFLKSCNKVRVKESICQSHRYLIYIDHWCSAQLALAVLSLSEANQLANSMALVAGTILVNFQASAAIFLPADLLQILKWTKPISNLFL